MDGEFGLSAAEELRRQISGVLDPFSATTGGGSAVERAMKEMRKNQALLSGDLTGLSSTERSIARAHADATRKFNDLVTGSDRSSFATAAEGIGKWPNLDSEVKSGIRKHLSGYESAAEKLNHELNRSYSSDVLSGPAIKVYEPIPLPAMPENPLHKTNRLLDTMVVELSEQRTLIEATAVAQKKETELVGKLVEAFVANQAASEKATKRSHMQAWIGIAIAIIAPLLALLLS